MEQQQFPLPAFCKHSVLALGCLPFPFPARFPLTTERNLAQSHSWNTANVMANHIRQYNAHIRWPQHHCSHILVCNSANTDNQRKWYYNQVSQCYCVSAFEYNSTFECNFIKLHFYFIWFIFIYIFIQQNTVFLYF